MQWYSVLIFLNIIYSQNSNTYSHYTHTNIIYSFDKKNPYIFTQNPVTCHSSLLCIFDGVRNTRIFLSIDCECEYLKQKIRFKIKSQDYKFAWMSQWARLISRRWHDDKIGHTRGIIKSSWHLMSPLSSSSTRHLSPRQ